MKVDYIIVGCGLAGLAFCEQLRNNNKTYVVIDDDSQQSSKVAGGLYNPVNLKRFTLAWKADHFFNDIELYYTSLERYLGILINQKLPVLRAFTSIEEQNNWFARSDKPKLSAFMNPKIKKNDHDQIVAPFGLGEVLKTGKIDTNSLIDAYVNKLNNDNRFIKASFKYDALVVEKNYLKYDYIQADYIVFCDGFGMMKNPFFKDLPLQGNKGEYIIVKAADLKLDYALKGSIFIIPLKEDHYLVGATYDNQDKTQGITDKKREELVDKLQKLIRCDFKVIDQIAAIRPTVKDRKPLVGRHPKYKNLYILNGLGTRGVMASPYLAEQLFNCIEHRVSLNPDIDINRYSTLFVS